MKRWILVVLLWILGLWLIITLFFVWDKKEPQIPEVSDQKREEVLNTYYNNPITQEEEPIKYWSLKVALPSFLYTQSFDSIKKELAENYNLDLQYVIVWSMDIYQEMIQGNKISDIDVLLIPNEWKQSISHTTIELWEPLTSYFDPLVQNLLLQREILPFLIDPLVGWVRIDKNFRDIHLETLLMEYEFLDSKGYRTVLTQPEESILSIFLSQAKIQKEAGIIRNLEKLLWIQSSEKKWKENVSAIYSSLAEKDSWCKNYATECLLSYWFVDMQYGYYSQRNIFSKLIKGKIPTPNIFPYTDDQYPVRMRGFVISKKSKNLLEAKKFLQYIISSFQYPKWYGIPAKVWESYYQALLEKELSPISGFKHSRYIIENTPAVDIFLKVIQENTSLQEYYNQLIAE